LKKQNLIISISIPQNGLTEKHQQIKHIKEKLNTFKKERYKLKKSKEFTKKRNSSLTVQKEKYI